MVQVTTLCWIFKSCFANLSALVSQMVKYMPAVQETKVGSLDSEDLLEKEMATHSSILAWRIPWTEDPGGVAKSQKQRSETNTCKLSWTFTVWNIFFSKSLSCELPPQLFPTFLFFKPFNSIIPLFLARDLSRFFEVQGFFYSKQPEASSLLLQTECTWAHLLLSEKQTTLFAKANPLP